MRDHDRNVRRVAEWFALAVFVALPVASLFGDEGLKAFTVAAAATSIVAVSPIFYELMELTIETSTRKESDDHV
jgi:hypothetical protein